MNVIAATLSVIVGALFGVYLYVLFKSHRYTQGHGSCCGPGKIGRWLVPDIVSVFRLRLDFRMACKIHDDLYRNPDTRWKCQCDVAFFYELISSCRYETASRSWVSKRFAGSIAIVFFLAVLLGGRFAWIRCRRRERKNASPRS